MKDKIEGIFNLIDINEKTNIDYQKYNGEVVCIIVVWMYIIYYFCRIFGLFDLEISINRNKELIDVEEDVRVPILFFEDGGQFVFLIIGENVVYRKIL